MRLVIAGRCSSDSAMVDAYHWFCLLFLFKLNIHLHRAISCIVEGGIAALEIQVSADFKAEIFESKFLVDEIRPFHFEIFLFFIFLYFYKIYFQLIGYHFTIFNASVTKCFYFVLKNPLAFMF